jgi:transcriptional regulator of heat shock response
VLVNGYDKLVVEAITVVPLLEEKALALIQTNSGYLNNTIDAKADEKACRDASNYLTKLFKGKTIGFLVENIELIKQGIEKQLNSFWGILDSVIENLKDISEKKVLKIQHEYSKEMPLSSKPEDMQKMLALLSDQEKITSSLSEEDGEVFVKFDESDNSLTGLALVRAPIILQGNEVAKIGVFGPERMNYPLITQALKIVIEELKGEQSGKKGK